MGTPLIVLLFWMLAFHGGAQAAKHEQSATEQAPENLDTITVYGESMDLSFEYKLDLGGQNAPSGDGADLLGTIPGFSLTRQGGAASDPVFRGLSGTRLNTLIDGVPYAGACNHRMDPATTYVNPGEMDDITLLRGPQSVRYGGSISGAVNFERKPMFFTQPGARFFASVSGGSFGKLDRSLDAAAGFSAGYFRISGGQSESDDYEDGDGEDVFSRYDRWNARFALGLTPDADTLFEISTERSDAEMANATVHMDATKLDRHAFSILFEKYNLSPWLKKAKVRFNRISVDHEMDDFSLRPTKELTVPFDTRQFIVMGQGWEEKSAHGSLIMEATPDVKIEAGMDYRHSDYDARALTGVDLLLPGPVLIEESRDIDKVPRNDILWFRNLGQYAELTYSASARTKWIAGLRYDRLVTSTGTMHAAGEVSTVVLSGANKRRTQHLRSGFLRLEHSFPKAPLRMAAGIGHAQRGADYWEVYSLDGFDLSRERNTELDVMFQYQGDRLSAELSFFYSKIDDFILAYNGVAASNVEAVRMGGEMALSYQLSREWTLTADIAHVYAKNITQDVPLAQTPPLTGRLGLTYSSGPYSFGLTGRFVHHQNRIHPDYGNTLAVDNDEPTPGYAVYSMEGSYKPNPHLDLAFGMDNIFDRTYYEHLNRSGSPVTGFVVDGKINEPGRSLWARLNVSLD